MSLKDLLARGYFPKELPNPFVTHTLANTVAAHSSLILQNFSQTARSSKKKWASKPYQYSHGRGGLLRRQLSLPNPVHHCVLCKELIDNWSAFTPLVGNSPLAATAPIFTSTGRALQGKHSQHERPKLAVQTRLNNRYILQTDISRFYHSIYTHTLAWALHSKASAKANRSNRLLGNRIDFWVRMGQDQQTIGIPIGPDTSLLLAELIMQQCDAALLKAIPNLKGHRFIDDYELGFRDQTQAEDAYHLLESCLGDFELALNPKKTRILELPQPLESPGVVSLRSMSFRTTKGGQESDLHTFFNRAFEFHQTGADESIMQYAVARLRTLEIHPANWDLFQRLLLLCVAPEPASLPYVLEAIITRTNQGATPAKADLEELLNTLIVDHTKRRQSSEVAWALWGCLALQLPIHADAVKILGSCEDSAIALLALDCDQHDLMASPIDKTTWAKLMTEQSLYDDQWLLAYEAKHQGMATVRRIEGSRSIRQELSTPEGPRRFVL